MNAVFQTFCETNQRHAATLADSRSALRFVVPHRDVPGEPDPTRHPRRRTLVRLLDRSNHAWSRNSADDDRTVSDTVGQSVESKRSEPGPVRGCKATAPLVRPGAVRGRTGEARWCAPACGTGCRPDAVPVISAQGTLDRRRSTMHDGEVTGCGHLMS